MAKEIQKYLRLVFNGYYGGDDSGYSNIEQLKLIPSLMSYYGDANMPDAIKKDGNALRSLLVKIELIEQSIIKAINVKEIPTSFRCIFRNENEETQMPPAFTFSPQINIPEYPAQNIEKDIFDEIEGELSDIDIIGILMYIKDRAVEAGDFAEAMGF